MDINFDTRIEGNSIASGSQPSFFSKATNAASAVFNTVVRAVSSASTAVKGLGTRTVSLISSYPTTSKVALSTISIAGAAALANKYSPSFHKFVANLHIPTVFKK